MGSGLGHLLRWPTDKGTSQAKTFEKNSQKEKPKCVEGHLSIDTNETYLAARATLKTRDGNEHNIARSFRMKLENWPKILSKDGQKLREFGD